MASKSGSNGTGLMLIQAKLTEINILPLFCNRNKGENNFKYMSFDLKNLILVLLEPDFIPIKAVY